jgi:hypothetical protein
MDKFKLDYAQIEHDSNVIKNFIINKIKEFEDFESFEKYVKGEKPYYCSEMKDMTSNILQLIKDQEKENYNAHWTLEYIWHLLDCQEFVNVMNHGLNTRKRKYVDREKFFEKYSN